VLSIIQLSSSKTLGAKLFNGGNLQNLVQQE